MPDRDLAGWQPRFDALAREHGVPGASLAVLAGGAVSTFATGLLHRGTGVETTTDSLFQIGSISKVYTATVLMRLIDQGLATVDTPVASILPGFTLADPAAAARITLRQLLCHTSGIDGDFFHDTGRGDDCLQRYVADCAGLTLSHPVGGTLSYCNTGYIIAGRVIEVLTGRSWDAALRELLLDPIGLAHTWTLPEDVLRFRAAMGHLTPDSGPAQPAPRWYLMRSAGPAGLVCATATDLLGLGRLHLSGGLAPDGTQVLTPSTVAAMQQSQVDMPHPDGMCQHWGLGWALFDWDGRRLYGHTGDTIGQTASLRVVPDAGVAIALLSNSDTGALHRAVTAELLDLLCGLRVPAPIEPPAAPPAIDPARHAGVYQRAGRRFELTVRDGAPVLHSAWTGEFVLAPAQELPLTPVTADLLLGRAPGDTRWTSYYFYSLPDGSRYLHDGARATPRVG